MNYELIKFNVDLYNKEFLKRDDITDLFEFCYEEINKLKDDKIYYEVLNTFPSLQKQRFIFELCDRYTGIYDKIAEILQENMLYGAIDTTINIAGGVLNAGVATAKAGLSAVNYLAGSAAHNPTGTIGVIAAMFLAVIGAVKLLHFYQVDLIVKWDEVRNAIETLVKADDRKAKLALIDSILNKNRFSCQELCNLSTDNTRTKMFMGIVNKPHKELEKKRISQHLYGLSQLPVANVNFSLTDDYTELESQREDAVKARCLVRCYLENLCIVIAEASNIYNRCLEKSGLHYAEINPEVINIPVAKMGACSELRISLETLIKVFRQIIKTYGTSETRLFNNPNNYEDFWLDTLANYIKQAKYGKHMKYINKSDELINDTVISVGRNSYSNINYTK